MGMCLILWFSQLSSLCGVEEVSVRVVPTLQCINRDDV